MKFVSVEVHAVLHTKLQLENTIIEDETVYEGVSYQFASRIMSVNLFDQDRTSVTYTDGESIEMIFPIEVGIFLK